MKLIYLSLVLALAGIQASAQQLSSATQKREPLLTTKSFTPNTTTGKLIPVHKGDNISLHPDVELAPPRHHFLKGVLKAIGGSIAAYQVNKSLSGSAASEKGLSRNSLNEITPAIGVGIGLAVPDVIKGAKKTRKPKLTYSFYDKNMVLSQSTSVKISGKDPRSFTTVAPADGFLRIDVIGGNKVDNAFNRVAVDIEENIPEIYEGNITITLGTDYYGGCTPTYDGPMMDEDVPTTMEAQEGNTCVPAILEYLNEYMGGDMSTADFIDSYHDMFGNSDDVSSTGMSFTGTGLNDFLSSTFTTQSVADAGGVIGALNSGSPVFAILPSEDPNMQHAVAIVGYCTGDNGSITYGYMDPASGVMHSIDAYTLNTTAVTAVVITGLKEENP